MFEKTARGAAFAGIVGLGLATLGCNKDGMGGDPPAAAVTVRSADSAHVVSTGAKLAALGMTTTIYERPTTSAKKLGYLRLGAIVARSDESYGTAECPGGWYAIAPRGFVCTGPHATLDLDAPLVRAASVRPDTSKPLPYAYGFVRSVSPLYLRVPSRKEQARSEHKLTSHLRWFESHKAEEQTIDQGANHFARELMPDAAAPSYDAGIADVRFFGGKTDEAPPPFWLEGGKRSIPNVTSFSVQPSSLYVNRIKRRTGVAFVSAFDAGPELDHRKLGVTVDLRLVPLDKVKPETGSPFHGVEITGEMKLPVAFARPCPRRDRKGEPPVACRHVFHEDGARMHVGELLPSRAFLRLTGTREVVDDVPYWQTTVGYWLREKDVAIAVTPQTWPGAAERGEKWIDVSVDNQMLVAWEGKKPVFVTLVSSGADGAGDPKTTKSTALGAFRIKSKHITTTMDDRERSAQSGGKAPSRFAGESANADDRHDTSFELREVPYVQYFDDGYALHGAYWHDRFGVPRSHGGIDLSPIDAMRVFRFTDPVPDGWHGAVYGGGTVVVVRR